MTYYDLVSPRPFAIGPARPFDSVVSVSVSSGHSMTAPITGRRPKTA